MPKLIPDWIVDILGGILLGLVVSRAMRKHNVRRMLRARIRKGVVNGKLDKDAWAWFGEIIHNGEIRED